MKIKLKNNKCYGNLFVLWLIYCKIRFLNQISVSVYIRLYKIIFNFEFFSHCSPQFSLSQPLLSQLQRRLILSDIYEHSGPKFADRAVSGGCRKFCGITFKLLCIFTAALRMQTHVHIYLTHSYNLASGLCHYCTMGLPPDKLFLSTHSSRMP